jgi:uncharacterized metal-binding protein YceD (DUF177 family)
VTDPEFSRIVRLDSLGEAERAEAIEADAAERRALARRFGLAALDALSARLTLLRQGTEVMLAGRLHARVTQSCVASGAPIPAEIDEPVALVFRPMPADGVPDDEIELEGDELDVLFHDGAAIDVGEAVAQSLALALDPYPRAPEAEAALSEAGVRSEAEAGPFAALAALKGKPKP